MTPEERAEKIYELFSGDCRHSVESACDCRQVIAAEIREAVDEAYKEALADYKADGLDIAYKQGLADATKEGLGVAMAAQRIGKAEAYEVAAKVLASLEGDCLTDAELQILRAGIASIRARKDEIVGNKFPPESK